MNKQFEEQEEKLTKAEKIKYGLMAGYLIGAYVIVSVLDTAL